MVCPRLYIKEEELLGLDMNWLIGIEEDWGDLG